MTTLTVYAPKLHVAVYHASRDVIEHALACDKFVSLETDGFWNFYVEGVPTDKATFCLQVGKQIADNGGEYFTSNNSELTMGYCAVAVGCQYYYNTHHKDTGADSAGALLAFVTNNTDRGITMTKNFELLKRLMLKAKEDAFLSPDQLPEGVYEATLTAIAESDKRTTFVFELLTGGKVAMSFGNDDTGLGFLAQTLVRLGVSADTPTFDGLKGTQVVLNIKHSASGEYLQCRIAAVVSKAAAPAAGRAVAGKKPAAAQAVTEVVEEVEEAVTEFDISAVEVGDVLTVQFGDEQKEGTLVSIDGDDYVINVDGDDYQFTADLILGKVEAEPAPEPVSAPKPPARGKPAAATQQKKAAATVKPAVTKKPAAPAMAHGVGDSLMVDIGDGKKYRTKVKAIEEGQYLCNVKGDDYLLTDEHIVG